MTYFSNLSERSKRILGILGLQLLFGVIGLFCHPGSYWEPLVFAFIVWGMSYCGYIPFGGFLLFGWLYRVPLVQIVWQDIWHLSPSLFTKGLFWIYIVICFLRTFQHTVALISPERPVEM